MKIVSSYYLREVLQILIADFIKQTKQKETGNFFHIHSFNSGSFFFGLELVIFLTTCKRIRSNVWHIGSLIHEDSIFRRRFRWRSRIGY